MGERPTAAWASGRAAAAAGLVLLMAASGGVLAQDGMTAPEEVAGAAQGMVTAQGTTAPPAGFSVSVSPYDDSALNLTLKADFEAALAARWQARVTEEAAADLLLLFESEVVPADLAPPPPSLGSARLDERGAEVNVNIWSSSKDSVLGGRRDSAGGGSNLFHINAVLRDRQSAEVVWQGDAYYVLREPEVEPTARALVPPLVDRIGQSVVREPLFLD